MKRYVLLIDLPKCPKGRFFHETIAGDFFHSMTDKEAISKKYKHYDFTKEEIKDKKFFALIK